MQVYVGLWGAWKERPRVAHRDTTFIIRPAYREAGGARQVGNADWPTPPL